MDAWKAGGLENRVFVHVLIKIIVFVQPATIQILL